MSRLKSLGFKWPCLAGWYDNFYETLLRGLWEYCWPLLFCPWLKWVFFCIQRLRKIDQRKADTPCIDRHEITLEKGYSWMGSGYDVDRETMFSCRWIWASEYIQRSKKSTPVVTLCSAEQGILQSLIYWLNGADENCPIRICCCRAWLLLVEWIISVPVTHLSKEICHASTC